MHPIPGFPETLRAFGTSSFSTRVILVLRTHMFSGLNLTDGFNAGVFVSFSACTRPKNRVYILSSGARDKGIVLVVARVTSFVYATFGNNFFADLSLQTDTTEPSQVDPDTASSNNTDNGPQAVYLIRTQVGVLTIDF